MVTLILYASAVVRLSCVLAFTLAHNGGLFLDELPEFVRASFEAHRAAELECYVRQLR